MWKSWKVGGKSWKTTRFSTKITGIRHLLSTENVESSVENTTFNKKIKTVYNLFGQKVSSSKKGIYVIDYGTHKKKIIKRYD